MGDTEEGKAWYERFVPKTATGVYVLAGLWILKSVLIYAAWRKWGPKKKLV